MNQSTTEGKTAPLPWHVDAEAGDDIGIAAADGIWICALTTEYGEEPYGYGTLENAQRIVAAVNATATPVTALALDACAALVELADYIALWAEHTPYTGRRPAEDVIAKARAALEAAGRMA